VSGGRVDLLVVAGYRAEEYAMFGQIMSDRGRLMEEGVAALQQAWTGKPFTYRGTQVLVRPTPLQQPRPRIVMAGDSRGAARRAARLADGYSAMAGGDSWDHYAEACRELGREVPARPRRRHTMFVHISEDPDRAWALLGRHLLHVNNSYAAWMIADRRASSYQWADSIEELRAGGVFRILTPAECIGLARDQDGLSLDPLCGGLPIDMAWESLHLFERDVLAALVPQEVRPGQ
jgi:alkanesulfonate monooxygenase SsuD/methylene tetrahydromethanopterin reductase-like flavin-dependent oxidoreductase (luciferase family)